MEELKGMITNPALTLIGILLVLREIHGLVNAIKALIVQHNDALADIKVGLARLYKLVRSR